MWGAVKICGARLVRSSLRLCGLCEPRDSSDMKLWIAFCASVWHVTMTSWRSLGPKQKPQSWTLMRSEASQLLHICERVIPTIKLILCLVYSGRHCAIGSKNRSYQLKSCSVLDTRALPMAVQGYICEWLRHASEIDQETSSHYEKTVGTKKGLLCLPSLLALRKNTSTTEKQHQHKHPHDPELPQSLSWTILGFKKTLDESRTEIQVYSVYVLLQRLKLGWFQRIRAFTVLFEPENSRKFIDVSELHLDFETWFKPQISFQKRPLGKKLSAVKHLHWSFPGALPLHLNLPHQLWGI